MGCIQISYKQTCMKTQLSHCQWLMNCCHQVIMICFNASVSQINTANCVFIYT